MYRDLHFLVTIPWFIYDRWLLYPSFLYFKIYTSYRLTFLEP